MNGAGRLGLLGGTFDPIHLGHIDTARAARAALAPRSGHRAAVAGAAAPRAAAGRVSAITASRCRRSRSTASTGLTADDMELCAPGPSYTADTLTRCASDSGSSASQLFFITGADAFAEIATWHRYPEVLDLAHFVVVSRPGFPAETLRRLLPSLGRADAHRGGSDVRTLRSRPRSGRPPFFSWMRAHPTSPRPRSAGASPREKR